MFRKHCSKAIILVRFLSRRDILTNPPSFTTEHVARSSSPKIPASCTGFCLALVGADKQAGVKAGGLVGGLFGPDYVSETGK